MKIIATAFIAAFASVTPAFASAGHPAGYTPFTVGTSALAALVLLLQVVPSLMLLWAMLKGLAAALKVPASPDVSAKQGVQKSGAGRLGVRQLEAGMEVTASYAAVGLRQHG